MKRALVLLTIFLVLSAAILPSPAWAGGGWHHGHRGGHGGWWWPGALIGGLALGAVAIATAPLWALAPPSPPAAYPPVVVEAPSAAYAQPVYSAPPASYQQAPGYARSGPPPFQREVVYDNGRYLLFGDGVRHAWQWVWVPAAAPPPPSPPPR